jgi:ABC-type glutathione transport system ATPase component
LIQKNFLKEYLLKDEIKFHSERNSCPYIKVESLNLETENKKFSLKNISFEINANQMFAISGNTGSG